MRYILTRRFSLWILGVVLGTRLAFEQTHSDRAHHFREVTHHGPLNSSVCNDYLIAGLCGVLFLRPESTSQLAAACVISLAFFSLHAEIRPYTEHNEDQLQFCAMLSITLTLLGGILLKTNTHKEDPNGAVVMAVTLITINAGVITLFIRHCYLTWRFPSPEVTSSGYLFITPYLLRQAFCQSLKCKNCTCTVRLPTHFLVSLPELVEHPESLVENRQAGHQEAQTPSEGGDSLARSESRGPRCDRSRPSASCGHDS